MTSHASAAAEPPDPRFSRRTVDADGVTFNVVVGGAGPALVLLHGWPLTWWSWRGVLGTLADAGFTVIAPDLPGLGESSASPDGYTKRAIAEHVRALVRTLGFERVALAGHDMGAPIAYAWARTYPEDVARLAILDVPLNGFGLDAFARRLGLWHFGFFAAPELPERLIDGNERALIEHFYPAYAPQAITPQDVDEYARTYTRRDVTRAGLAYYRAMADDETWMREVAGREKLRMPVLALGGEFAGNFSPFESMAQLAHDVRARIIANCGHYLAEEQPAATAAALLAFFTGDDI